MIDTANSELRSLILEYSRQNNIGPLSPWFSDMLDRQIQSEWFYKKHDLDLAAEKIVHWLISYRLQTGISTVVLGMSGGVDSALTAALFRKAGYYVYGLTMPIHQAPEETERGIEACKALGLHHVHVDLSNLYDQTISQINDEDLTYQFAEPLGAPSTVKIRRGNVRARLRMITLYNYASLVGGFVASTDNFSELLAGFWTLHGDVGDVSPIQSMLKSWEVPYLASVMGVPESTWRATPTDGLGVTSGGDEAQFGCSYLELDIMFGAIAVAQAGLDLDFSRTCTAGDVYDYLGIDNDSRAPDVFEAVVGRIRGTWFKRKNPLNLEHPLHQDRFALIADADRLFAHPKIVTG